MSFLNPIFLLGLPLVAVPVVIHLLNRRQQKWIAWGAMRFLMQAATRKRRLWRMNDLLLLLLRVAALLFFIFALARPLMPSTWLAGTVPRDVILVLDASLSMSRRENGATLLELGLDEASRALDTLSGSDSVRVLLAGETPEWLTTGSVPASAGAMRQLKARLAELKPTLAAGDVAACVREAADLEPPKDKSARAILVITDGQRFGWRMDEGPLWESLRGRLDAAPIPTTLGVRFVGQGHPGPNLAVNRLETTRPHGAAGQSMLFTASLENHGTQPTAATLLAWQVNGEAAGVSTVPALAAGASTSLTLTHPFPTAGLHDVTCRIEGHDEISGDDVGHSLVDIHERLPVLLVGESSTGGPWEGDLAFVLAALGAQVGGGATEWKSVFAPTVITPAALETTALREFRCVLLADVGAISEPALTALTAYVRNGGGLWITLGPRTEPGTFNDRFVHGGSGLAPLKLGAPVGDAEDREHFVTVRAASEAHPATALLSDFQRLDLDRVRVYRRHVFEPGTGRNVSVLLQAQGGEPVVVERKFGRGRVLVQSVPLGVVWSTLPLCQAYVAMLHEWLWYTSEPDLPRRNLAVGEALVQAAAGSNRVATLTPPGGATVQLRAGESGGGPSFRHAGTRWPGLYDLTWGGTGAPTEQARFQVLRNPLESSLAPLTAQDRASLAQIKSMRLGAGLGELTTGADGAVPKRPLEGWLLGALPFLLLIEMLLAGWTTRRRQVRVKPVAMEVVPG